MELQKMFVTLALKADEFKNGLGDAGKRAQGFGGQMDSMFSKLAGKAKLAMAGVGLAIAAGFGMAIKSSIEVNAQLETTQLQFETLMGNADLAREHVAGLFKFAEKTPFETGPIIDASLKLQTFGGAALNTMGNIQLLGDAAAATNAPIDELGFWVGRLYANLEAGQPFGEAAMRLQELAVMSPQARTEMERLQKEGKSAAEVFAYFQKDLGKFTGAMEKQASTWQGMTSTIKDQISLVLAEALRPFFDEGKEGLQNLIKLLNDPDIVKGIKNIGASLGELATTVSNVFGDVIAEVSALGIFKENNEMMEGLRMNALEMRQLVNEIKAAEGIPIFGGGEEDLALATAVNEALREMYTSQMMLLDASKARSEWDDFAREKQAALEAQLEATTLSAVALDEALAANATGLVLAGQESDYLAAQSARVWEAQNKARLETRAYVADLAAQEAAMAAAAVAAAAFSDAFGNVVEQYTTALPGAGEPLVKAGGIVSIITGGLGAEGVALMGTYEESIRKLQTEIFNLSNGVGTYGQSQEEVNKKIAEAQGELTRYQGLLAPLAAQTGDVSTAQYGLSVNVGGVRQAIFDQLVQMGAAPEVINAYGVAIGVMSEAQAEAALKAAAVKVKIEELATAIAGGMPVEKALADLDSFIFKLENGITPAAEAAALNVPQRIVEMKERIGEEALASGRALGDGLDQGIAETMPVAQATAETAAEDVISATKGIYGVESPSTVFHGIGADLMQGLTDGINSLVTGVVNRVKAIGGQVIDGIIAGINDGKERLRGALSGVADLIPDWLKQFLGIASPARATVPIGEALPQGLAEGIINTTPEAVAAANTAAAAIVEGFVEGIQEWAADATEAFGEYISNPVGAMMNDLTAMLDFGNKAGGVAGGFARHFQRMVLDPMEGRLDTLQGTLDDRMPGIAERWQQLTGFAMPDWNDRSQLDAVLSSLYRLQRGVMPGSALAADVQASIDAMTERNGLEAEYIRQQERLLALEQARADMDFLKQQMELLGLMGEHNIPLSALGGLQLGLTADPGQLVDAMVTVMETIVRDAQYDLNNAFNQSPAVTTTTPGTDRSSTMNVQTQNINGGQHIYLYDTEESELGRLGVLSR